MNTNNPYMRALEEGRALTDNELAIDWARLQTQNHMLALERDYLRRQVQVWRTVAVILFVAGTALWLAGLVS